MREKIAKLIYDFINPNGTVGTADRIATEILSLPSGLIAGEHELTIQEKLEMCDRMFPLVNEMSQINEDQVSGKRGLLKNVEVWNWLTKAENILMFNGQTIRRNHEDNQGK